MRLLNTALFVCVVVGQVASTVAVNNDCTGPPPQYNNSAFDHCTEQRPGGCNCTAANQTCLFGDRLFYNCSHDTELDFLIVCNYKDAQGNRYGWVVDNVTEKFENCTDQKPQTISTDAWEVNIVHCSEEDQTLWDCDLAENSSDWLTFVEFGSDRCPSLLKISCKGNTTLSNLTYCPPTTTTPTTTTSGSTAAVIAIVVTVVVLLLLLLVCCCACNGSGRDTRRRRVNPNRQPAWTRENYLREHPSRDNNLTTVDEPLHDMERLSERLDDTNHNQLTHERAVRPEETVRAAETVRPAEPVRPAEAVSPAEAETEIEPRSSVEEPPGANTGPTDDPFENSSATGDNLPTETATPTVPDIRETGEEDSKTEATEDTGEGGIDQSAKETTSTDVDQKEVKEHCEMEPPNTAIGSTEVSEETENDPVIEELPEATSSPSGRCSILSSDAHRAAWTEATDGSSEGDNTQPTAEQTVGPFSTAVRIPAAQGDFMKASSTEDFVGNTDNNTVVQNDFNPVIKTRYIRVVPKTHHVAAKMRIEFLGCDDTDACQSNPCKNGGTCVDGLDSYSCNCTSGYSGDTCEDTDDCQSNPCKNGGTCVDGLDSYSCNCTSGYSGDTCEGDIIAIVIICGVMGAVAIIVVAAIVIDRKHPQICMRKVYYSGAWGSVCLTGTWAPGPATVACRMLGFNTYGSTWALPINVLPAGHSSSVWKLNIAYCSGTENTLSDCVVTPPWLTSTTFGSLDCQTLLNISCKETSTASGNEPQTSGGLSTAFQANILKASSTEINFASERHVTGIQTQGFEDGWVETFQVETAATGSQQYTWTSPFGMDFTGNTDNNTVVQNDFNPPIKTRYIRVVVKTYHVAAKMRIEFLGCDDTDDCQSNPCKNGGTCVDGLNSYSCNCTNGFSGDTCEEKATTVELPTTVPVPTTTPITTASQTTVPTITDASTPQVSTTATTQASTTMLSTTESTDLPTTDDPPTARPGTTANATTMDIQTTVIATTVTSTTPFLPNDVSTQHTTTKDKHPAALGQSTLDSGTINTKPESTSKFAVEDSTTDTTESSNQPVSQPVSGALIAGCNTTLGMRNGLIENDQINASSYNTTGYEGWRARLYGAKAWWMALGDTDRWIQIDFRSRAPRIVTGIQTQGLWGGWVTSYTVSYSNDSVDWSMYGGGQINVDASSQVLSGNTNGQNDTVQHDFTPPVVTRYLRVNVLTWHDQIARLRMELLGCDGIDDCAPQPCANGATCLDGLDLYTCVCGPGYTGYNCSVEIGGNNGLGVGIVLGILCFLLLMAVVVYYLKRR
uniref:Uncharacterized protein n=1 Tax=Branchiostoma floridae TaxID=7739 RepID=C3ZI37_BRAFL|eukprot:XP_002591768.1 hypothetical protein BRAFLDRAFT_83542 [Branchiostoma floridae]